MALFGKKSQAPPAARPLPTGVPTDVVLQMRQQRFSNNQIMQSLQREGYNSTQIFDAMSQADIKGIVESAPPQQAAASYAPQEEFSQETMPQMPPPPQQSMVMPPAQQAEYPVPSVSNTKEEIEEIAEGIIDEKWEELMKSVEKIVAWKDMTEAKIIKLEQQMMDLKSNFEELHRGVLAKISEYDSGIRAVGTEIKAMESVFKKVLPSLTENVGELSRITKKLKQ